MLLSAPSPLGKGQPMNAQLKPVNEKPTHSQEDLWLWSVDERAKVIDANTDRVIELFMDEAMALRQAGKGEGGLELIELSVLAMNAWPVIEKRIAGLSVTPAEAVTLPAFFRALKPLFDQRAVLVRETAEDELKAEAEEAAQEVYL